MPVEPDRVHDPAGPGQQHPAPPLQGAPAADHQRARHGPRRPPRGPPGGAQARPPRACARPARCCRSWATRTRVIENFIKDSDTVVAAAGGAQAGGRRAGSSRPARPPRSPPPAARSCARRSTSCPASSTSSTPTMARLEDLTDEQIPLLRDAAARGARPGRLPDPARPVRRGLAAGGALARRGVRGGRARVREGQRTRSTSCARLARRTRPPPPSRCASSSSRWTTAAARSTATRAARSTAPPAERPVATAARPRGFTGLESIWNYFFWQGLSINGFDDVGHVLRLGVVTEGPTGCSRYENDTPQSDPVAGGEVQTVQPVPRPQPAGRQHAGLHPGRQRRRAARARPGKPAKKVGERRKEGQPDAGPLPGQKDISKPQITLPPAAPGPDRRLPKLPKTGTERLDQLLQGETPAARAPAASRTTNQLLDFLLAP